MNPTLISFELLPVPTLVSQEWDQLQYDRYTQWMAEEVTEAYSDFIHQLGAGEIDEIKEFFLDGLLKNVPAEILFCELSGEEHHFHD